MTRPSNRSSIDAAGFDLDVRRLRETQTASAGAADPSTFLLQFDAAITSERAEALLGRLTPPEEGIVLAGSGAVIVRAGQAFVDAAEAHPHVALVSAVRRSAWEPTRHRVPANPSDQDRDE